MATSNDTTKSCSHCKLSFPATLEYFTARKTRKSGLSSWCKTCQQAEKNDRRARDPKRLERQRMIAANEKRCTSCKEMHPNTLEYFGYLTNGKNGLNPKCRACHRKSKQDYRANHPERRSAEIQQQREYGNRPEIRERLIIQRRERRQNPEFVAREKELAQKRLQTEDGKAIKRAAYERRRARLLGAEGTYTVADVDLQYRSQRGLCWHCGEELNGVFQADHLIPLTRGGTNWPNNIVCSCPRCNRSKHNKLTQEWNGKLF